MDIQGPQGFTAWHLAYLSNNELLTGEVTELGPMVDMPEAHEAIVDYLIHTEGVMEDPYTLTQAGKDLLHPLTRYRRAWWGMVMLRGFRTPLSLDIDEELLEYGVHLSITDIPRVFFLITESEQGMTFAVRAGDEMSITQEPVSNPDKQVAQFVDKLCNPEGDWSPAQFQGFRLPHTALHAAGFQGMPEDDRERRRAVSRMKQVFKEYQMPEQSANNYIDIVTAKPAATVEILTSTSSGNVSKNAVSLGYYFGYGAVVMFPEVKGNTVWANIHPANPDTILRGVESLRRAPMKPRLTAMD